MRGLAYNRFQREKHIKRKENILRKHRRDNPPHIYNDKDTITFKREHYCFKKINFSEGNWYPFHIKHYRGQFNKGKIHCSCPLCSAKTNKIFFIGTNKRNGKKNYCFTDLKKYKTMKYKINEFYGADEGRFGS